MCSISGFSPRPGTRLARNVDAAARTLAVAGRPRGRHAFGFGWTGDDAWPVYWKREGDPGRFARQAPLPASARALIAHTRFATQGDPKFNENNHPVVDDGLVLVHNGVVRNDAELYDVLDYERSVEVDSAVLGALIAWGPDVLGGSPLDALGLVEGRAAVAWLDTDDGTVLHLARVTDSPIILARTASGDLLFASTEAMLFAVERRLGLRLTILGPMTEGSYIAARDGEVIDQQTFTVTRTADTGPRLDQGDTAPVVPVAQGVLAFDRINPALRLGSTR